MTKYLIKECLCLEFSPEIRTTYQEEVEEEEEGETETETETEKEKEKKKKKKKRNNKRDHRSFWLFAVICHLRFQCDPTERRELVFHNSVISKKNNVNVIEDICSDWQIVAHYSNFKCFFGPTPELWKISSNYQ